MQQTTLRETAAWIIAAAVFITPLITVTSIANSFHTPKIFLLVLTAAGLLGLLAFHYIKNRQISLVWHPTYIPVLVLLISYLLSSFIQSPNLAEAWYERTFLIASLTIIYLIGVSFVGKAANGKIRLALLSSATILALFSIAHVTGVTNNLSFVNPDNPLWNLTGSPISLILWSLVSLSISFVAGIKDPSIIKKGAYFCVALVQGIALAVVISDILLNEDTAIINLPQRVGYTIAIDNLKNPQSAILGMGPDNYLAAFSFFKPAFYNTRYPDLWNIRFSTSSNELFHVFTINGLLGAGALIILLIWMGRQSYKNIQNGSLGLAIGTIFLILGLLLFPANATTLTLLYTLLLLLNLRNDNPTLTIPSRYVATISAIVMIAVSATGIYYMSRFTMADYYINQAALATAANQPNEAIQNSVRAIQLNPRRVAYRLFFSDLNFRIANALARQENLSQDQQEEVLNRINISINQARVAASLNVQNVNVWEHQARVYSQLVNLAQGADQATVNAYQNAITLDPRNPRLRVEYGQFLQTRNQLEAATQLYREARDLKQDYSNAYFNLSAVFEAQNRFADAFLAMQRTVQLLDPNSNDYAIATERLKTLQEKAQQQAQDQQNQQPAVAGASTEATDQNQELTQPNPAIEPSDNLQPINLEEEQTPQLQPEDTLLPISSTPTPTPTPTTAANQSDPEAQPSSPSAEL